ncbi:MAG: hypothetical protein WCC36_05855 [Gammaproteobacteria bacterium]
MAILFLLSLVTHGLLLLNDGTYWDDWLIKSYLANHDWASLHQMTSEMGLPLFGYFFWGVHALFGPHGYTVVAFALVTAISLLIYALLAHSGVGSHAERLAISALALTFPAYRTSVLFITLQYLFCYTLFLLTALMVLKAESWPRLRRASIRPLALALFFLSFNTNSLLVFYFVFLGYLFYDRIQRLHTPWWTQLQTDLPRHLDYLILPFVYWTTKLIFFPRHGDYANYNRFDWAISSLWRHLHGFLYWGMFRPLRNSFDLIALHPLVGVAAFTILALLLRTPRAARVLGSEATPSPRATLTLMAVLTAILFAGLFPYIAVGLSPGPDPWDSRFNLLTVFPFAILIVATSRFIALEPASSTTRLSGLLTARWLLLITLIAASALRFIAIYIDYEARWVKDRSVITHLTEMPQLRHFSVIAIKDRMPIPSQPKEDYRWYEWTTMFHEVWGGTSTVGHYADGSPRILRLRRYYTTDFHNDGCNATLTIAPGPGAGSHTHLAFEYLFLKYLHPGDLHSFLRTVTELHYSVTPKAAASCHNTP